MATSITLTTNSSTSEYTLATGGRGPAGSSVAVETTIIDGNTNAVSGNAVFDAINALTGAVAPTASGTHVGQQYRDTVTGIWYRWTGTVWQEDAGASAGNATHTGDATGAGELTLATVNSNIGSFTNASLTVNAKGLVTAASSGTAPVTSVTGTANQITVTGTTTPTLSLPSTINVNTTGNAATVTTNANQTGAITGTGNTNVLGSFTLAQLNTAVSDSDVARGIEIKTSNFTAVVGGRYILESGGTITVTNPAGTAQGESFECWIGSGSGVVNGVTYAASRFSIRARYTGAVWATPTATISDTLTVAAITGTTYQATTTAGIVVKNSAGVSLLRVGVYDATTTFSTGVAEGVSIASGNYSHAEGTSTASGGWSHAEGKDSTASGSISHAEGYITLASGSYSHAAGRQARAIHDGARVMTDSQAANCDSAIEDSCTMRYAGGYRFLGGSATFSGAIGATTVTAGGTGTWTGSTFSGAQAFSGDVSVTGNTTVAATAETAVALGTVTTTATIAITAGTLITATLTASTACTFTMPAVGAGKSFTLLLKQAATTGNGTATFSSVKWPAGTAPTITATAGKMDILTFVSDGTNWYGSIAQNFTP